MRTLYLNGNRRITVRGDGPSLLIKERQRADRRVPLRLIGQVIIRGNIILESGVITLLAEQGVPVSFLSSRGEVTATALTLDASNIIIRERVDRLSRSAKGSARVNELLRAGRLNSERRVVMELLPSKTRGIFSHGLREEDYRNVIAELLSLVGGEERRDAVVTIINGLFHELTLKSIIDLNLDPHRGFLHLYQNFAFVKDLGYVLEAECDRQLLQFFRAGCGSELLDLEGERRVVNGEGMRKIVTRFESQKKRIIAIIDLFFRDFFTILREAWI